MSRRASSRRQNRAIGHFVGRVTEQRLFRSTLVQLAGLRTRRDEDLTVEELSYPQLFLIAAEGGMGKTTLLRRFEAMVGENAEGANVKALYLDWERHAPITDPDHFMRVLHDALCAAGFESEMQPYRDAIAKRTEARQKAADAEEKYKSLLANAAGWAVQVASQGVIGKDAAASGVRVGAEATQDALAFIRKKLSPDEWKLYDDPHALTEAFIDGLTAIATPKRPFVLLLDTYEVADRCDKWLRERALAHLEEYPRLIVVIAGREAQPFIRRYEDVFPAGLIEPILLDTFARPDIETYLHQCGLATPDEGLIDQLQALSRGIPLALEGWVNLYQKQVDLPPPDPSASTTRQAIVRRMTDRFLRYCNDDDKHLPLEERKQREATRNQIFTLMLLRHTKMTSLAAAWHCDTEQAEAILGNLADQFSFIFAQEIEHEPHALVKAFLRDYLRDLPFLPVAIENAIARLITHFEEQLRVREQMLVPAGDLRRPLWQDEAWRETMLDLINALCWTDQSGERPMRLIMPLVIEALEFKPDAITLIVSTPEGFIESWRSDMSRTFKVLATEQSLTSFLRVMPNEVQMILGAVQPVADQWQLTWLQRAILHLHQARILLEERNDPKQDTLAAVLSSINQAARLLPADGGELRESLVVLYKDVGSAYLLKPDSPEGIRVPEQPDGAIAAYQQVIHLDPNDATSHSVLGFIYLESKQYEAAIPAYQQAIHLDPNDATSHSALGLIYREHKQYDAAIDAAQQALKLNPNDVTSHKFLGFIYLESKQYEAAIAAFQQVIHLDPNDVTLLIVIGEIYSLLNRHNESKSTYQQAIQQDPNRYQALVGLACIERQTGDQKRAAALVAQVRPLIPVDDFYVLACLESIAGNVDAAVDSLRIALERHDVDVEWAREDPDFIFIRDDSRYRILVGLDNPY